MHDDINHGHPTYRHHHAGIKLLWVLVITQVPTTTEVSPGFHFKDALLAQPLEDFYKNPNLSLISDMPWERIPFSQLTNAGNGPLKPQWGGPMRLFDTGYFGIIEAEAQTKAQVLKGQYIADPEDFETKCDCSRPIVNIQGKLSPVNTFQIHQRTSSASQFHRVYTRSSTKSLFHLRWEEYQEDPEKFFTNHLDYSHGAMTVLRMMLINAMASHSAVTVTCTRDTTQDLGPHILYWPPNGGAPSQIPFGEITPERTLPCFNLIPKFGKQPLQSTQMAIQQPLMSTRTPCPINGIHHTEIDWSRNSFNLTIAYPPQPTDVSAVFRFMPPDYYETAYASMKEYDMYVVPTKISCRVIPHGVAFQPYGLHTVIREVFPTCAKFQNTFIRPIVYHSYSHWWIDQWHEARVRKVPPFAWVWPNNWDFPPEAWWDPNLIWLRPVCAGRENESPEFVYLSPTRRLTPFSDQGNESVIFPPQIRIRGPGFLRGDTNCIRRRKFTCPNPPVGSPLVKAAYPREVVMDPAANHAVYPSSNFRLLNATEFKKNRRSRRGFSAAFKLFLVAISLVSAFAAVGTSVLAGEFVSLSHNLQELETKLNEAEFTKLSDTEKVISKIVEKVNDNTARLDAHDVDFYFLMKSLLTEEIIRERRFEFLQTQIQAVAQTQAFFFKTLINQTRLSHELSVVSIKAAQIVLKSIQDKTGKPLLQRGLIYELRSEIDELWLKPLYRIKSRADKLLEDEVAMMNLFYQTVINPLSNNTHKFDDMLTEYRKRLDILDSRFSGRIQNRSKMLDLDDLLSHFTKVKFTVYQPDGVVTALSKVVPFLKKTAASIGEAFSGIIPWDLLVKIALGVVAFLISSCVLKVGLQLCKSRISRRNTPPQHYRHSVGAPKKSTLFMVALVFSPTHPTEALTRVCYGDLNITNPSDSLLTQAGIVQFTRLRRYGFTQRSLRRIDPMSWEKLPTFVDSQDGFDNFSDLCLTDAGRWARTLITLRISPEDLERNRTFVRNDPTSPRAIRVEYRPDELTGSWLFPLTYYRLYLFYLLAHFRQVQVSCSSRNFSRSWGGTDRFNAVLTNRSSFYVSSRRVNTSGSSPRDRILVKHHACIFSFDQPYQHYPRRTYVFEIQYGWPEDGLTNSVRVVSPLQDTAELRGIHFFPLAGQTDLPLPPLGAHYICPYSRSYGSLSYHDTPFSHDPYSVSIPRVSSCPCVLYNTHCRSIKPPSCRVPRSFWPFVRLADVVDVFNGQPVPVFPHIPGWKFLFIVPGPSLISNISLLQIPWAFSLFPYLHEQQKLSTHGLFQAASYRWRRQRLLLDETWPLFPDPVSFFAHLGSFPSSFSLFTWTWLIDLFQDSNFPLLEKDGGVLSVWWTMPSSAYWLCAAHTNGTERIATHFLANDTATLPIPDSAPYDNNTLLHLSLITMFGDIPTSVQDFLPKPVISEDKVFTNDSDLVIPLHPITSSWTSHDSAILLLVLSVAGVAAVLAWLLYKNLLSPHPLLATVLFTLFSPPSGTISSVSGVSGVGGCSWWDWITPSYQKSTHTHYIRPGTPIHIEKPTSWTINLLLLSLLAMRIKADSPAYNQIPGETLIDKCYTQNVTYLLKFPSGQLGNNVSYSTGRYAYYHNDSLIVVMENLQVYNDIITLIPVESWPSAKPSDFVDIFNGQIIPILPRMAGWGFRWSFISQKWDENQPLKKRQYEITLLSTVWGKGTFVHLLERKQEKLELYLAEVEQARRENRSLRLFNEPKTPLTPLEFMVNLYDVGRLSLHTIITIEMIFRDMNFPLIKPSDAGGSFQVKWDWDPPQLCVFHPPSSAEWSSQMKALDTFRHSFQNAQTFNIPGNKTHFTNMTNPGQIDWTVQFGIQGKPEKTRISNPKLRVNRESRLSNISGVGQQEVTIETLLGDVQTNNQTMVFGSVNESDTDSQINVSKESPTIPPDDEGVFSGHSRNSGEEELITNSENRLPNPRKKSLSRARRIAETISDSVLLLQRITNLTDAEMILQVMSAFGIQPTNETMIRWKTALSIMQLPTEPSFPNPYTVPIEVLLGFILVLMIALVIVVYRERRVRLQLIKIQSGQTKVTANHKHPARIHRIAQNAKQNTSSFPLPERYRLIPLEPHQSELDCSLTA